MTAGFIARAEIVSGDGGTFASDSPSGLATWGAVRSDATAFTGRDGFDACVSPLEGGLTPIPSSVVGEGSGPSASPGTARASS